MNQAAGVKVGEVLDLVPGTRLLAGTQGLNRPIQSIGIIEAPDSLQFAVAGDLILTALWAIRDDRGAQLRLVPELVRRRAAGLAIKLRYVDELPRELLEQAEAHGFPVLQLTTDVPYSQVMQPIMSQIINRQAIILERQQRAHRAVMQAVLEAKGLPRLAETLAELLENPVVIRDELGQVLAVGPWGDPALNLEELAHLEPRSKDYLLSTGDTMHSVEGVYAQGQRLTRLVAPVKTGNTVYGQVQTWELGRRLDETDLAIIDSVTTVVALEMANRRALLAVERRYHNEFLAVLFAPEVHSEADLLVRAGRFGWDLTKPHYAVALQVEAEAARPPRDGEESMALQDRLHDAVMRDLGPGAVVGQAQLYTVILLPAKAKANARAEGLAAARLLQEQAQAFCPSARVTVGVGTVQSGVVGVRRSFEEARKAIRIGERAFGPGDATHYADLGVYQILAMLEPAPELDEFLVSIRTLDQYDVKHQTELIKTLECYLSCKGNVRKVSEQMYAHYNTILYRLQRIAEITGQSPEDSEGRFHLYVALQAYRLFGPAGGESAPVPRRKVAGK